MTTIIVTPEDAKYALDEGTVISVQGTDPQDGSLVTIAGDWRSMSEYLAAIIEDGHAHHCEVENWQILGRIPLRRARVEIRNDQPSRQALTRYLPANYWVAGGNERTGHWIIEGHDNAGWTLDGYVVPRLASGLIIAEEVSA
jgi:hypothetical protein